MWTRKITNGRNLIELASIDHTTEQLLTTMLVIMIPNELMIYQKRSGLSAAKQICTTNHEVKLAERRFCCHLWVDIKFQQTLQQYLVN